MTIIDTQKQFKHFLQRAKERYNLDLTLDDLQEIAETIKSGRARLTQFDSVSARYKVRFKSKLIVVVLSREHSHFITALPITKYTQSSNFNGKKYFYKDALYMNWQFSQHFDTDNIVCPVCGCSHISSDLGHDRFKCLHCYNLVKFKEVKLETIMTSIIEDEIPETAMNLSLQNWWYLYLNHKTYEHADFIIQPVLCNDDDFRYIISYKQRRCGVPVGTYSIKEIRRYLQCQMNKHQ